MSEKFNFSKKETYTLAELEALLEQHADFARKGTAPKDELDKKALEIQTAIAKAQEAETKANKYKEAQATNTTKSIFESLGGRKEAYADFYSRVKPKTDELDFLTDQTEKVRLLVNETKKAAPHLFKAEAFDPLADTKGNQDDDDGYYPGTTIKKRATK